MPFRSASVSSSCSQYLSCPIWFGTLFTTSLSFDFDTSYTLINVPYTALTAELTEDYDERSSLTGWRMSVAILANLITAGLFKLLAENVFANWFGDAPHALQYGYMVSGCIVGVVDDPFDPDRVHLYSRAGANRSPNAANSADSNVQRSIQQRPFRLAATIYLLTLVSVDIVATVMVPFCCFTWDLTGDGTVPCSPSSCWSVS